MLTIRQHLRDTSDLGEIEAATIHREWLARGLSDPLSVRTICLILERLGALDRRQQDRRQPPRPGSYLPRLADGRAELDSFDLVEGLAIRGGTHVEVLQ